MPNGAFGQGRKARQRGQTNCPSWSPNGDQSAMQRIDNLSATAINCWYEIPCRCVVLRPDNLLTLLRTSRARTATHTQWPDTTIIARKHNQQQPYTYYSLIVHAKHKQCPKVLVRARHANHHVVHHMNNLPGGRPLSLCERQPSWLSLCL